MEPTITKKIIPSTDPRLKRHINHDSRSANFPFPTLGVSIKSTTHKRLIPILDQGLIGSCTGNAGIGCINTDPFKENFKTYTPDETGSLALYRDAEIIDGGIGYPPEDIGSSGLSVAKALKKAGLISDYKHCFTLEDTLKAMTQYPVIIGTNWYEDMFNPDADGRVHPTGALAGGHEYVGFQIDVENGRIYADNSWTTGWGLQGTFYITWQDFAALLANEGDVIVLIPPTKMTTLKLGDKNTDVLILQENLIKLGYTIAPDTDFGPATLQAVKEFQAFCGLKADGLVGMMTQAAIANSLIIADVAKKNNIEPVLLLAIGSCEGGLTTPNITSVNNDSHHSTDRGIFQWNSFWDANISDAQAFDVTESTQLVCDAIKDGHLVLFWHLSMPCWSTKLTPEIKTKYGVV